MVTLNDLSNIENIISLISDPLEMIPVLRLDGTEKMLLEGMKPVYPYKIMRRHDV
jgi:hypothetical protein